MTTNSAPDQPQADPAEHRSRSRSRRLAVPLALGAAGMVAGAILAGSLSASAATTAPSATAAAGDAAHSAETPVTDTTAANKIKAAVLAKYPGATIDKVEVDDSGYEAEITTAAGAAIHVNVTKAFVVTGERGGGRGGHSNTDPAHEANESAAQKAAEAARDAAASTGTNG